MSRVGVVERSVGLRLGWVGWGGVGFGLSVGRSVGNVLRLLGGVGSWG